MGHSNSLLWVFILGFVLSIPPGPASFIVLGRSLQNKTASAWSAFFHLFLAELIILMSLLAFGHWSGMVLSIPLLKSIGGVFLIGFVLSHLFKRSDFNSAPEAEQSKKAFFLTLANPIVWAGYLAMIYMFEQSGHSVFVNLVAFELGVIGWFTFLIYVFPMTSQTWHLRIQRVALGIIFVSGVYLLTHSASAEENFKCTTVRTVNKSQRQDCVAQAGAMSKTFHILKLKGDFAQIAYDQGYLMGEKINESTVSEIKSRIEKGLHEGSTTNQKLKNQIYQCYRTRIVKSMTTAFKTASSELYRGSVEGAALFKEEIKFSKKDFLTAAIGVEIANAFDGLLQILADDKTEGVLLLTRQCGLDIPARLLGELLLEITGPGKGLKMGCLGFVVPESNSAENALMHARNFDSNLLDSWNRAPTVFMVDETPYLKYVAAGTAGLLYPGAISGFNEKGISVSLHEMSTTKFRTRIRSGRGNTAPFIQHQVLRQAKSIDEAIKIIKQNEPFSAWTMLVADGKNNEIASIEFSGEKIQVARRTLGMPMGQANHFVGSQMKDQYFTYSFGKELETNSRLTVITQALNTGEMKDLTWMIDHLAGHQDAFEGFRSFGRTGVKAYNVASTVAVPKKNEFWMTIGERYPAAHSHYVGVHMDWANFDIQWTGLRRTHQYDHLPNWENSLNSYVNGFRAYENGKPEESITHLSEAIDLAAKDGIVELPYRYTRGRVALQLGRTDLAAQDWYVYLSHNKELHPHGVASARLYGFLALDSKAQGENRGMLQSAFDYWTKEFQRTQHFDLKNKVGLVKTLIDGKKAETLPPIDFITVE